MKKVCKMCGRNRKIGKFGKLSAKSDCKNIYCRECMRKITNRYKCTPIGRRKQIKAVKKYKDRNKESIKDYNRQYYLKNKERILLYKKSRENTESILITEKSNIKKINNNNKKKKKHSVIVINPKRK